MSSDTEQKTSFPQRLIAGSLLGLLIFGAVHFLYLQPAFQIVQSRQALSELALNLESLSKKIEGRSNIQKYVASASARIQNTDAILRSPTYSLAVSSLQVLVSNLANRHGLVVRRMQGLPRQTKESDNVEVRLRLQAVAKNTSIAQFLNAVAAHELLMSVDHLNLSVRRAATTTDNRSYIEDIDVEVTVELSALWREKRGL